MVRIAPAPSPGTHTPTGELTTRSHTQEAPRTAYYLSVRQNTGALKKPLPEEEERKCLPRDSPDLAVVINAHQAEASSLNHLFSEDVYEAVCQVAAPSREALVRGGFTYYLAPQPAGGEADR